MTSVGKRFPFDAVRKGVLEGSVIKTFLTAFTYRLHALLGTWKNVDAFLPLTAYAGQLLLRGRLSIPKEHIDVKPNFIEPLAPVSGQREPYFLFIGRLSEEKGIRQLLQVFNRPDAPPLRIIGDGPLRNLLNTSFNPDLRYLGHLNREEVGHYLARCKGVVVPSVCLEGGFTLVLMEGLALKTPVILSRLMAASEIIKDGENGFLIDPRDFSEKLQTINQYPDLDQIGEAGFKTYELHFTKEKVMHRLEEIYQKVLRQSAAPG